MTADISDPARHCLDTVRTQDHDRWLTLQFAAADDRPALAALYAFNHEVAKTRETVSEPMLGQIRLEWWRESLDGIAAGQPRKHPVVEALGAVHRDNMHALPLDGMRALIDAREQDLLDRGPADFDALIAYADATGGRLGTLAVTLCGAEDSAALEAASNVGRAWALTGLLRALAFQAAMQRTPLPDAELQQLGIARETLFRGAFSPELTPLIQRMAEAATDAIAAARSHRHDIPPRARNPLLLAPLAAGYLKTLARADWDPFSARFERGAAGRHLRLLWAGARGRF